MMRSTFPAARNEKSSRSAHPAIKILDNRYSHVNRNEALEVSRRVCDELIRALNRPLDRGYSE
jgi:hypothetical protein